MRTCPACRHPLQRPAALERCRVCRALVKPAVAGEDRVGAHDAAYFGEQPAYEMNSAALLARYAAFLDRHRPLRGAHVLDVGCGDSPAADVFAAAGAVYTGLEPSAAPRERLAARGVRVVADLGEVDADVDVVTLFEVLEHLPDPHAVLGAVRERLPEHGVLFLTTPNADGLQARLRGAAWEQVRNETHLCLYTRGAVTRVLDACGYRVVDWQRRVAFPQRSPLRRVSDGLLQTLRLDGGLRVLAARR